MGWGGDGGSMVKFGLLLLFSVTRFGEISTFWYNLKSQIFQGLSGIWHNFVPTVSKNVLPTIWQDFIVVNGHIL